MYEHGKLFFNFNAGICKQISKLYLFLKLRSILRIINHLRSIRVIKQHGFVNFKTKSSEVNKEHLFYTKDRFITFQNRHALL